MSLVWGPCTRWVLIHIRRNARHAYRSGSTGALHPSAECAAGNKSNSGMFNDTGKQWKTLDISHKYLFHLLSCLFPWCSLQADNYLFASLIVFAAAKTDVTTPCPLSILNSAPRILSNFSSTTSSPTWCDCGNVTASKMRCGFLDRASWILHSSISST